MRTRPRFRAPWLAFLLLASGCASAAPNPFAAPGEQGGGQVRILVQNRAIDPVRIYAVVAGDVQELGQVGSRRTAQLHMDWPSTGNLRFRLEPLTGLRKTTSPIIVRPGDIVDLYITSNPSDSYARVR